jgi:hypothetical protein
MSAIAEGMRLYTFLAAQPRTDPIIVKIIEPPSDVSGLADVLLGALGLTGVIVAAAVLCGFVFAGLIYFVHSRQAPDDR